MSRSLTVPLLAIPLLVASLPASTAAAQTVHPPAQPASGPGGVTAAFAAVDSHAFGDEATGYWIFTPAGATPDAALPIIVFLHGWGGVNPNHYGAWIDHVVRRGTIVIYPNYQTGVRTPPVGVTDDAIAGVKAALQRIDAGELPVTGDPTRFALIGHSAGGVIAANIAARAAEEGLPRPRALMSVAPGLTERRDGRPLIPAGDWESIPAGTLLLTVAGEDDTLTGNADARLIYRRTNAIDAADKDFVLVRSDPHGAPALTASHAFATTGGALPGVPPAPDLEERDDGGFLRGRIRRRMLAAITGGEAFSREGADVVDALDYYGTWKLFDALTDAAFYGSNREYALGDTPEQRSMGRWSDGTPVAELIVSDPED